MIASELAGQPMPMSIARAIDSKPSNITQPQPRPGRMRHASMNRVAPLTNRMPPTSRANEATPANGMTRSAMPNPKRQHTAGQFPAETALGTRLDRVGDLEAAAQEQHPREDDGRREGRDGGHEHSEPACASVRSDQMAGLRLVAEKAADPILDCTIRLGYALVLAQMLEP